MTNDKRTTDGTAACAEFGALSRRRLLKGGAASLAMWGCIPRAAIAGTRDPRMLTIVLRGGLDGLSMIAPVGDPDYEALRPKLALTKDGPGAGLALDGFFVLNPGMPYLHSLYAKGQALAVHAVSTPYRGRSHFDGQDVLESGLGGVARTDDGWLNRALAGLPTTSAANPRGLAMGAIVPLVMRGKAPVMSWIPKTYGFELRDSTVARLMDLYGKTDAKLAGAFAEGMNLDRVTKARQPTTPAASTPPGTPAAARPFRDFVDTAETAAKFLSASDGPRVATLSYNGWDTHANEGAGGGQLSNRLAGLDAAIKAFAEGMGPAWSDTVVVVVTEFGRTAAVNGTEGTDHGTATAALLVGGAVKGGRVIANWPGLAPKDLYEARDLAPTLDLRTVFKGVLRDHLGVPTVALAEKVFPDSRAALPADGLIA
jgi:uncharacterized protein (DUF1501 family)